MEYFRFILLRYGICILFASLLLLSCTPSIRTLTAIEEIGRLKSHTLLIEMEYPHEDIAKYRKFGYNQKANRLTAKYDKRIEAITASFESHFDYCQVYFYYEDARERIGKGETEDVLMNAQLSPVNWQTNLADTFYIGIFTTMEIHDGRESSREETVLKLLDMNFRELQHPFPAFTEAPGYPGKSGISFAVKNLNSSLHKYYIHSRKKVLPPQP